MFYVFLNGLPICMPFAKTYNRILRLGDKSWALVVLQSLVTNPNVRHQVGKMEVVYIPGE